MALSAKQKLFVAEYLVDRNATRAAKAAGYSQKTAHSQGPRLLEHVGIKKEIGKKVEKALTAADVTSEMIISELAKIAMLDPKKQRLGGFYKSTDKVKCLEILAKYKKLLTDSIEVSGKDGGAVQIVVTLPDNGFGAKPEDSQE